MRQRIIQWILNVFGIIYVLIEQFVEYPDDDVILGMEIDEDLQTMSRKQLTSKIRLGCQLLREYKQLKRSKTKQGLETGSPGDYDF